MYSERPYFTWPVYGLSHSEKSLRLANALTALTWEHSRRCEPYGRILKAHGYRHDTDFGLDQVPFIPVRLFKEYELSSILKEDEFKILTSSGTTSQLVSRIVLDRDTAMAQTKALVLILQQFLGKARLPMLIIDHPNVIKSRQTFSARGAGILGLSNFGRDQTYALRDEDMAPDIPQIQKFLDRHRGEKILIFGFTFMVWKYFFLALQSRPDILRFEDAILLHSGGWKKLLDEAVDNTIFKKSLADRFNIHAIHNFYGMVEQVGSVFMECEYGRHHAPAFADVLIRDPLNWTTLPKNRSGIIQVLSVLPTSYPGHSLLTEDLGEWTGLDECPCGRLGRTFHVQGRIAHAELRGCSDTHAAGLPMEF